MGMAEDEPLFRLDEDIIDSGKPCKIPVPRRADGKLGFSIIIQKCSSGNIAKVTQVKDTCLSRELTKYHYITKIDEIDIRHLKTPMEVESVLSLSSGTVVLLEAYRSLYHDSNDNIQRMSLNSSVCSSSNSSSTNSMNSLLLDADGSCHSQPVPRPIATDTVSLKDAVFKNPDSIQWDAKPKTVILKRSSSGKFGFVYEVLLSSLVPKNSVNTSMYFLITKLSNDAARKLKVGDLILSLNGIACQDLSVKKVIDQKIETESELRLIIQRPVKFKHRNNPCVEQKRICPIKRVFLCGPAAMVYYNFLVNRLKSNRHKTSQNYPMPETNLNNDTAAFKASCVWTQRGTFFVESWSKRSWFYHLDVKHLIALELLASSDESFFHHCMKLTFTKNSIFFIMLDCQLSSVTQGSKQAELRMLKRYIHTIQSCVGKEVQIKVKCVCQDNSEQCRNQHNYFIDKIMVEPIVIPSNSDQNSDTFVNSVFELAKQKEISMSYHAAYALHKLYHLGLCKSIATDFFKTVHKVFDKISQQDLHQTVREMSSFKYYIGVNSRKSALLPQGNSLYVNIEYVLNSMSQLAYQPISLVSRSHTFSQYHKIPNGIVDQQVLVDNLYPSDVFSHSVLALLESHNVILSLKESGQYACTKYYIPCLQHSYQMEVQNPLMHNVFSLYIQFCSSAQHTDFLRLVISFGNLYGWELPQEIQLSQCNIMVGTHMVHFQYQWQTQQVKITSEITTQSNEETLFHIFQQLHQVCVAVFPYSFFKYYGRCHNPQCIYCCHSQRKHESPIFCTHLINETQVKQIGKVIDVEKMSVLELNSKILFHICLELNSNPSLNWKMLAGHLNCDLSLVGRYESSQDPCINVLVDWNNTSLNSTAINFRKILHDMKRYDLAKLVEEELDKLRREQSSDC
ncbi:XP_029647517.1uncharacterized protein LOC115221472 [Octopus vulgaris]|uniref:XP_029647517.1uncharacterized protein LOC115221472 n=1 Tax=Octopus vulgaris TaxID=6645 RepID=A0AA36BQT8_OCTVU|nr:XP_029647517.1uncharacterized protein LOC115221472 [Octopus vulgaris]